MNVRSQLLIASFAITAISITTVASVLGFMALESGASSLEHEAKNQLIAIRETKSAQIEDYFKTVANQVLTFSNDRMIIDATLAFTSGFNNFTKEVPVDSNKYIASLDDYYANFGKAFKRNNNGETVDVEELLDQLIDENLALQYHYISNNPHPSGEKDKLTYSADGSSYSNAHKIYHPHIRDYLKKFGYYDIFIIDSETGNVVYSVYKGIDYATSLTIGAFASSGLSNAFRGAVSADSNEFKILTDFAPHLPSFNLPASFIASPIFDGDKKVGVLVFQMPVNKINDIMTYENKWKNVGLGETGETYLVGADNKARSNSRFLIEDEKNYMEMMAELGVKKRVLNKISMFGSNIGLQKIETQGTRAALSGKTGYEAFRDYRNIGVLSAYAPIEILGLNWAILSEIDEEEAFRPVTELRNDIVTSAIVIFIAMLILSLGVAFVFSGRFVQPILQMMKGLRQVARGDLSNRYESNRSDELGSMIADLDHLAVDLSSIVSKVTDSSIVISHSVSDVASGNANLSQRTQEQASSLEEIASSMEEMTGTVNQNTDNAMQADQLASAARDQADKSGKVVGNAIRAMNDISDSSKKIVDIISVIDEIAFQTNLLALNAAVEAARAGDQGRGFGVVASEVRSLAGRSATAAKEIKELINDSVNKVDEGTRLVDASGEVLQEIATSVKKVSDIVSEIASASREQSDGIGQVNRALLQMDEMTQQNASLVEEAAAASEAVDAQSEELINLVGYFTLDASKPSNDAEIIENQEASETSMEAARPETEAKNLPDKSKSSEQSDEEWTDF